MKQLSAESILKVVEGLATISRGAGATDSATFDAKGFGDVLVILVGGTNQATGTNDTKLRDSADDSTYADIASAVFTQITTANDEAIYIGILRQGTFRRYIQARQTIGTAACIGGVIFVGLNPQNSELSPTGAKTPVFKV